MYVSDVVELQRGEFRQATEDRHTHLYQNPWYALRNIYSAVQNI